MLTTLLYILIILCSIFLICLVLIQRGRGGGLAGAFGGAGGSSAFGTRAGDVFTRITIVTASIWIALNMLVVILANQSRADRSTFAPVTRQADGTTTPTVPGKTDTTESPSLPLDDLPGLGTTPSPIPPTAPPSPAAPEGERTAP